MTLVDAISSSGREQLLEHSADAGMLYVLGGTFRMGSDRHYPEEAPVHRATVDGFWMDRTPVTNRQFRQFVEATGYVTFAETAPDLKDYPGALPHMLKAGSLAFAPPRRRVDLCNWGDWWTFKFGANWRRPYGPGSSIRGLDEHPVVHVAFKDAEAYANWASKELPTEAEWELAARGGLDGAEFAWGDELTPGGRQMSNTWQGEFPNENLATDGYERTSPVTAFPPNGYGLHDMIGNVWEWTTDWYVAKHEADARKACCIPENPRGGREDQSYDLCTPNIRVPRKVLKGGRICARPTIAAATGRRRAIPSRSTHRRVTSGSAASNERKNPMTDEQNRCRSKQGWLLATGLATLLITLPSLLSVPAAAQQITGTPGTPRATMTLDGKQLPPEPPKFGGDIKEDAKDSKPYWPPSVVPPKSAPNVLLIMTDDQGYGVTGTFGGVIPTPNMDRVAKAGLRYTQFHSTALCSPTRAALITGRNHHSVGFGVIGEMSTGYPGYDSVIGTDSATIGTILRDNGFATSWFGKNHNTPTYLYSSAGPFDQWPVGMGFEYFYGFMGGETDQWTPYLFRNTSQVFPWIGKTGYNLITDMADDAINYMNGLNAAAPDKPFFVYYVPGGTHSPHQPKKEWIDKFKGKFDMGWEKLREQIFANQKKLGVIPANTQLTAWPDSLPKWDSLSFIQKKLYAREAEVFAGYAAYTDNEIGRVIQAVEDMGKLDNTLVIYISGDNGTSAEGTLEGTPNQMTAYNGVLKLPEAELMLHYENWGSDKTYPHMSVAWSWAFDTPFKWTKQVASHFGGTRQGMVMSWPGHIKDVGGIRSQFHHIIDIVPTILEATGIPAPATVNGIAQKPIEGVSMAYTFDQANANAPSKRDTQYFEMFANRGIYHDGWYACTTPPAAPWLMGTAKLPDVSEYKWELYNITEDFSQSNDLAAKNPDKLKELQTLFLSEAAKYQVLPLDNSILPRLTTPRPSATAGRTEFTYKGVNPGIPTDNAPNIMNKDYKITADITVPNGGAEGMIVTLGGRFSGYGLYLLKGKPVFVYNMLDLKRYRWEAGVGARDWLGSALKPGKHTIAFDFKYDGPGFGKGGTGVLSVDGKELSRQSIPHSISFLMAIDESFDVGVDTRTGVDDSYKLPFQFTGKIDKLTFKLGPTQLSSDEQRIIQHARAKASD